MNTSSPTGISGTRLSICDSASSSHPANGDRGDMEIVWETDGQTMISRLCLYFLGQIFSNSLHLIAKEVRKCQKRSRIKREWDLVTFLPRDCIITCQE